MATMNLSSFTRRLHLTQCLIRLRATPVTARPTRALFVTSHWRTTATSETNLDSAELIRNMIRTKLTKNLKLSTDQANFALLKCLNSEARFDDEQKIDRKIALINEHFQHEDICHNLEMIGLPLNDLQNRVNILIELGFDQLQVKLTNSLPQLMCKTVGELKQAKFYSPNKNPCLSIVNFLKAKNLLNASCDKIFKPQPELLKDVDSYKLSELRSICLLLILRQMLGCSEQVASHIVENFNCQRNFDQISFTNLMSNLDIFINVVNLPINQLIKHFVFLINYKPENLLQLANIKQFQENSNLRHIFFTRQRLLQLPPDQVAERVKLLVEKYKCTNQQLLNCITLLELPPEEIEANFGKFKTCEQLKSYASHPNLLRLISNIDLVLGNVERLADRNMSARHITLHNLLKSTSKFNAMVKNSTFQLTLNSFTQLHFDSQLKDLKGRIGWIKLGNRPLNSANAERIITYFRQEAGLSDAQITNGIYLIYCQFETVKQLWEEMFEYAEVRQSSVADWRAHPYVLHLLHYFIERAHRF